MLAIEIELLTGRYVATAYNDREQAEWPPHPARLYSAFVATWAEDEGTEGERRALEWLERQPPPTIVASTAWARTVTTVFVPVNDVQTVSEPDGARSALLAAEAALDEARAKSDEKEVARAEKALEKARVKLASDTRKATAPVSKVTGEGLKAARAVLPDSRIRQPRTFPSVTPALPIVRYVWAVEPPEALRAELSNLCDRVVRLGHSSSLVRAAVDRIDAISETEEVFVPDDAATDVLRVPAEGLGRRLEDAFALHRGVEPRILPAEFQRYGRGRRSTPKEETCSLFGDDWTVFERHSGDRLPIVRTVDVAEALRGGVTKHAAPDLPATLTGHEPDGRKIEGPHVAFVPLPYVGSDHADGSILGVALVLPRALGTEDRRLVARGVGRWEEEHRQEDEETPELELRMGRAGVMSVRRVAFGQSSRATLRPGTWCAPSRAWLTATPIALDRNPGNLHDPNPARRAAAFSEAEATVVKACTYLGLPEPEHVDVVTSSVLQGAAKPRSFPPFPPEREKHQRVLVHARIFFAEPVRGPIILGAGRYFGLGLCRPVAEASPSSVARRGPSGEVRR